MQTLYFKCYSALKVNHMTCLLWGFWMTLRRELALAKLPAKSVGSWNETDTGKPSNPHSAIMNESAKTFLSFRRLSSCSLDKSRQHSNLQSGGHLRQEEGWEHEHVKQSLTCSLEMGQREGVSEPKWGSLDKSCEPFLMRYSVPSSTKRKLCIPLAESRVWLFTV